MAIYVRDGDTPRSLSEGYLVRPTAWDRVVEYNYILKPGNMVRVPKELVQIRERAFLEYVSGKVLFRPAGRPGWFPAVSGLVLLPGDRVRTGTGGGAVLRTGIEDRLVLRSGAEVVYEPARGFFSGRTNRMTIVEGTVFASTRKRSDREARFVLRTPDSELDLVGTEVRVSVTPGSGTRFEVLEGEITVEAGRRKYLVPAETGLLMSPPGDRGSR